MNQQMLLLNEVAKLLGVQPYRITYALAVGKVPEPTRIANKRIFQQQDIARLAAHFGLQVGLSEGRSDDGQA